MNHTSEAAVRRIAEALNTEPKNVFPFGDSEHDLDIAVIIRNDASPLDVIEALSGHLIDISLSAGRLVTVSPIREQDYHGGNTGFLRNVRENRGS